MSKQTHRLFMHIQEVADSDKVTPEELYAALQKEFDDIDAAAEARIQKLNQHI